MKKVLFSIAAAALVAGCASPYKPYGLAGGFSETRRADDYYVVRFEGNGYTRQPVAEEMALLRAAELAKEKGFKYLTILNEGTSVSTMSWTTPVRTTTTGSVDRFGGFQASSVSTGGQTITGRFPTATLHVGFANEPVVDGHRMLEAQSIYDDLSKKYPRR